VKGETVDVLMTYIMNVLHKYKLTKLLPSVGTTVKQILEGLQGEEQTMFLPS
jgi:hypothetical protein